MTNAKNSSRTSELFLKRRDFNNISDNISTKDTYVNEKILLGKVNLLDRAIVPRPEFIEQTRNTFDGLPPVSSLVFVSRAFDDMVKRFNQAFEQGKILKFTPVDSDFPALTEMIAYSGYSNPITEYTNYLELFTADFRRRLIDVSLKRKIKSFSDYLVQFMETYLHTADNPPMFYNEFVLSSRNSQLNGGLAIETHIGPYDDDGYKVTNFYLNPNFNYYQTLARQYGFIIDRHIPWRLIADINSFQMQSYMYSVVPNLRIAPQLTTENILSFFYQTPEDFNLFVGLIINSYNDFASAEPFVKIIETDRCGRDYSYLYERDFISTLSLDVQTRKKILDYYILFKDKYYNFNFSKADYNRLYNDIQYFIGVGKDSQAIDLINSRFNKNDHLYGSVNHRITSENFRDNDIDGSVEEFLKSSIRSKL